MFTTAFVNTTLDTAIAAGDKLSLHTAYSTTGANEVSGGTYARQTGTWSAASGRSKALSSAVSFTGLPASVTVAFVGHWDSTGATFKGMTANGGTEFSFQVDLTNDKILVEGSGYANDDRVVFTGTPPTGLTEGTIYFVVGVTAGDPDTFQVAATSGGAAINITGQAAVDCKVSKVVLETFTGAGGTLNVNTYVTKL